MDYQASSVLAPRVTEHQAESAGGSNEVRGSQTSPLLCDAAPLRTQWCTPKGAMGHARARAAPAKRRKNSGSNHTSCHCTSALLET